MEALLKLRDLALSYFFKLVPGLLVWFAFCLFLGWYEGI